MLFSVIWTQYHRFEYDLLLYAVLNLHNAVSYILCHMMYILPYLVEYAMAYMNWGPHQPSTSYEECVAVIRHGFWGDKQCIDNNHIICQVINDPVPTASPVSATESHSPHTEDDIRPTTAALHIEMNTTKSMSTGSQSNACTSYANLCRSILLSFSIVNNGCASNTHCSPFTFSNHTCVQFY